MSPPPVCLLATVGCSFHFDIQNFGRFFTVFFCICPPSPQSRPPSTVGGAEVIKAKLTFNASQILFQYINTQAYIQALQIFSHFMEAWNCFCKNRLKERCFPICSDFHSPSGPCLFHHSCENLSKYCLIWQNCEISQENLSQPANFWCGYVC